MNDRELLEKVQAINLLIVLAKNDDKQIVYLSGKVTGLPSNIVEMKFAVDAASLRGNGYFVFNPTEWLDANCNWEMAMRMCLAILPLCDIICIQSDWFLSDGAVWEISTAKRLWLEIREIQS